jgi:hypothetical protein
MTEQPSADQSDRLAVYWPKQIACGALLGSPLAGAWLLRSNLRAWNDNRGAAKALWLGILATVVVFVLALILPSRFPNSVLPATYTFAIYSVAKQTQGERFAEHKDVNGPQKSNWSVVGVGLLSLVVVMALVVALVALLPSNWIAE